MPRNRSRSARRPAIAGLRARDEQTPRHERTQHDQLPRAVQRSQLEALLPAIHPRRRLNESATTNAPRTTSALTAPLAGRVQRSDDAERFAPIATPRTFRNARVQQTRSHAPRCRSDRTTRTRPRNPTHRTHALRDAHRRTPRRPTRRAPRLGHAGALSRAGALRRARSTSSNPVPFSRGADGTPGRYVLALRRRMRA
jgi:hypothetical protein